MKHILPIFVILPLFLTSCSSQGTAPQTRGYVISQSQVELEEKESQE